MKLTYNIDRVVAANAKAAAAIGSGLPVSEPRGCMIVDVGASTCDAAIISRAGIVHSCRMPTAGDAMTASIVDYFHGQNLDVEERDAEAIKASIGSACPAESEQSMEVNGRDSETGTPKTRKVTSEEIREAIKKPVSEIVDAVRETLAFLRGANHNFSRIWRKASALFFPEADFCRMGLMSCWRVRRGWGLSVQRIRSWQRSRAWAWRRKRSTFG